MATTSKGTPYVEAADLVSGYPTVSLNLAEHIDDNVAYNAATINAQTGTTYTFALADATEGKLVTATNAASQTYTVPPESSVTWPAGSILRILNQGAGVVTVAAGSGVTINGTPLTLAQYKGAAIQKTGTDTWTFIPFSGGVGSAVISSPAATGSYTDGGGTTWNYYTFTASGTVTVDTAGFADVLLVGGGGGGGGSDATDRGSGGGGGGGFVANTNVYLSVGTHVITVGAGGAGGGSATFSKNQGRIGGASGISNILVAVGGGPGGGSGGYPGGDGASGGGGGDASTGTGGSAYGIGQGNNGANGAAGAAGGGGGAGAAGSGSTGGAGSTNAYNNTSNTYCAGGNGEVATPTSGAANTGDGGDGESSTGSGGSGGSGIVIVRVAV